MRYECISCVIACFAHQRYFHGQILLVSKCLNVDREDGTEVDIIKILKDSLNLLRHVDTKKPHIAKDLDELYYG